MDQLRNVPKSRRDVMEDRIANEHARLRLRFNERIDFLERIDRNGRGTLVPVIRRRSPTGRVPGTA